MILLDELTYYPTYGDPLRACTARGRIFRIIPESYVPAVKEFLASELFKELLEHHYIPKTSISLEVEHADGDLVLEHEKLFKTSPNEWSYTQFKDAAIFLLELQKLCIKHGYYISDAHLNNIVFDHGHPVFLDFGSFVKGKMDEWFEAYWNSYFIEVNYLILCLWSHGQTYICRSILDEQRWKFMKLVPEQSFKYNALLMPYIHRMVKKYDVYLKPNLLHIPIHSIHTLGILNRINHSIRKVMKKPVTWHCFKVHPRYKQCGTTDVDKLHYDSNVSAYYPIERIDRVTEIARKIINREIAPRSLLQIGNYTIESIEYLRTVFNGTILISNDDTIYMDTLYCRIKEKSLDIHTICINALFCSDKDVERLNSDVVICDDAIENRWVQPINSMAPGVSRPLVLNRLKRLANKTLYPHESDMQICGRHISANARGGVKDEFVCTKCAHE